MKLYVGLTDRSWFDHLAAMDPAPDELNFWRPGGLSTFKAVEPGAPFLFKLHSPSYLKSDDCDHCKYEKANRKGYEYLALGMLVQCEQL